MIPNGKVIGGWDYPSSTPTGFYQNCWHGTMVASIIGALTNDSGCWGADLHEPHGMAGIGGGWDSAAPNFGSGVKIIGYGCYAGGPQLDMISVASAILEAVAYSTNRQFGFGVDVVNFSGGGPFKSFTARQSFLMRNAVSEAYWNDASFVTSKGDNGGDIIVFPSDIEPPSLVLSIGASNRKMSRLYASAYNSHLDLIAPGGEQTGPDTIVLGLSNDNMDPIMDSDAYQWFGETSAAAAHVSGVAALLRGYLKVHLHDTTFAREDIEGILKASALDLGDPITDLVFPRVDTNGTHYGIGYDTLVGWGFLRAGYLFGNMLDTNGYQLGYVEVPRDSAHLHRMGWSDTMKRVTFYMPNPDTTKIKTNIYNVIRREVTGSASYAGLGFNTSKNVYVWGNTKDIKHRGYANEVPNWQEPWCEDTTGLLGFGTTSNSSYVPGIRHETSTNVGLRTYQYHVWDTLGNDKGLFPPDSLLGLGYTVFGSTVFSSGVKSGPNMQNFSVWPSIATDRINVSLDETEKANRFQLVDVLGRILREAELTPQTPQFYVITTDLPSGLYMARIIGEAGIEESKIIVRH